MKTERNSSIELLKNFSMIGVIILHYNNKGLGQAFTYAPLYSTKSYILFFLQAMFICAVNVFVLISGYFMCNATKIDAKKPMRLLIQVVIFRELIYIVKTFSEGEPEHFSSFAIPAATKLVCDTLRLSVHYGTIYKPLNRFPQCA